LRSAQSQYAMRNVTGCREAVIEAEPDRGGGDRGGVRAATTAAAVLKGLAALGGRASLAALAGQLRAHPSKLHRYLKSLAAEGLVARDPLSQAYLLGPEAILVGLAAMRQSDPIRAAEPALLRLRDALDATTFLAVPGNRGPTVVRLEEPDDPVVVNIRPGFVLSILWSATGRALLAASADARLHAQAREELAHTPSRRRALLPEAEPITAILHEVREAGGIATVRDLYLDGVSAAAAPIFDFTGAVRAILTVLGPTGRFPVELGGPVVSALRREAEAVSLSLGWQPVPADRTCPKARRPPPRGTATLPLGSPREGRPATREIEGEPR
jgi:DNA-binding IclR family transcriptional regulator